MLTDNDKALVKQLRWPQPPGHTTLAQAADRIEALSAENERLRKLLQNCDPESMSWLDARDAALGDTDYGDMTKEDYEAIYGWGGQG